MSSISAYTAAKAVNAVLVEKEILETSPKSKNFGNIKVLPPQMFYNYTTARINDGKEPLIECDENGKIVVESLEAWLVKYLVKLENRTVEEVPSLTV